MARFQNTLTLSSYNNKIKDSQDTSLYYFSEKFLDSLLLLPVQHRL